MFSSDDYFVHLVSIGRRPHGEHFVLKYFDSGPVVQDEMSFRNISYLQLWQPSCSRERNNLSTFRII